MTEQHRQRRRPSRRMVLGGSLAAAAGGGSALTGLAGLVGSGAGDEQLPATEPVVDAGSLVVEVARDPWTLVFTDASGNTVLTQDPSTGSGPGGRLGFHFSPTTAVSGMLAGGRRMPALPPAAPALADTDPVPQRQTGWFHATRAVHARAAGAGGTGWTATLATDDLLGRKLDVRIAPVRDGVVELAASVRGERGGVTAVGVGFAARPRERFFGFGERSNATDQRGRIVEHYVGEGPYQKWDYPLVSSTLPPWGVRARRDATYFPVPWLLSSAGYGVLVTNTEPSYHRLGTTEADTWSVETGAAELRLLVFAGPHPADVLARFTATTGRQPYPAEPWFLGPWFQTGQADQVPRAEERSYVRTLRRADAPVSAAETHLRYLPCGAHQGRRARERERTSWLHGQGLAVLGYASPMVCEDFTPAYARATGRGLFLARPDGRTYRFQAFVGGRDVPLAGVSAVPVAQYDFTAPGAAEHFHGVLSKLVADGHDGWMEDFGEYTPLDAHLYDGTTGWAAHNRYPRDYHRAGESLARSLPSPPARFVRSGWTGVARHVPIVWGGDPTTAWGFDGLTSAVRGGLTMGLSGVSTWASDIGGYFSLGAARLSGELLVRWIQFGALTPVMRTKAGGVAIPAKDRPQIWDPAILPHWRRWAKLHTQLSPYLLGAAAIYAETGLPLMRHHVLTHPYDRAATGCDDQYLFGPDLLAAPVTERGARTRALYVPAGTWVDLWRTVRYDSTGGGLVLDRTPRELAGERWTRLPAPLEETPLLVRVGAVLPLLPPEVYTLSDYGQPENPVRLADRADRLDLLAFPHGTALARVNRGEWLESREGERRWELELGGERERTYRLQASLGVLNQRFEPGRVTLDGEPLPAGAWSYDPGSQVLTATFTTTTGTLGVEPGD